MLWAGEIASLSLLTLLIISTSFSFKHGGGWMLWEVVTQSGEVELRAAFSWLWCEEDEIQLCIFSRGGEAGRLFDVGFEVSSGG